MLVLSHRSNLNAAIPMWPIDHEQRRGTPSPLKVNSECHSSKKWITSLGYFRQYSAARCVESSCAVLLHHGNTRTHTVQSLAKVLVHLIPSVVGMRYTGAFCHWLHRNKHIILIFSRVRKLIKPLQASYIQTNTNRCQTLQSFWEVCSPPSTTTAPKVIHCQCQDNIHPSLHLQSSLTLSRSKYATPTSEPIYLVGTSVLHTCKNCQEIIRMVIGGIRQRQRYKRPNLDRLA